MNISKHSSVSPREILADVLLFVGDESFKDNSEGYYMSLIQQALQELAFDTFFDVKTESFAVPSNLCLEMPKGMFNIRQMYLYNGPVCDISRSQNVYWKRDYYTRGNGYLARDKWNNRDPFYPRRNLLDNSGNKNNSLRRVEFNDSISNLFYYNIQNGLIMLSSNATAYENIAIEYNGTGGNIGDIPFIPMLYREAIKAWVLDSALKVKMARSEGAAFNKWQTLYAVNNAELRRPFTGLWAEAEVRAKSMDSKAREDMKEYLGRLDY
jgi:hypothetical protein